ncbi:MAG: gliding motility protein GldN [Muribaculaceae bacterium]|nr:gliding motility protein GldN [Muribaculaceae bacterium]
MKKIILFAIATVVALSAVAQSSTSSGVVRKRAKDDEQNKSQAGGKVTQRMQSFYEETPKSEAELAWEKVVYRMLDLTNVKNATLYYPEEPTADQESLFRIIMRLLANDQIPAYEYLDGREVFTDQYRVKVKDILDRFHVIYTQAKGSTEKSPKYAIDDSDVPANEVLSYYIIEKWQIDNRNNRMETTIEAICPVLHRSGDFGGEAVRYPMFWIKFDNLRPYLTQQYIFVDDDNNLAKYTYDDFFQLTMYEGDIYKTRNLRNLSLMQQFPDPDELKHAQDSIQHRLLTYTDKMWVPTREELEAAREKRELEEAKLLAAANGEEFDEEALAAAKAENKEKKSTKTKRGKAKAKDNKTKAPKAPKSKEPKVKESKSNSSAVKSVRRRR